MAFALPTAGRIELTLVYIDEADQETSLVIEVPWDTDLATTLTNSIAVADAYGAGVSKLALNKASVRIPYTQGTPQTPVADSTKFMMGLITSTLDPSATSFDPSGTLRIPDPVDAVRLATSGSDLFVLDIADALITAVTGQYEAGTGVATLSDGQTLNTVKRGRVAPRGGKIKGLT